VFWKEDHDAEIKYRTSNTMDEEQNNFDEWVEKHRRFEEFKCNKN
jgi:hypothetical protein